MPNLGVGNRSEWMGDVLAVGVMAQVIYLLEWESAGPSHGQTVLCHIRNDHCDIDSYRLMYVSIIQFAIAVCSKCYVASKIRLNKPSTRVHQELLFYFFIFYFFSFSSSLHGRVCRKQKEQQSGCSRRAFSLFFCTLQAKNAPRPTKLRLKAAFDSSSRRASRVQPTPEKGRHMADCSA